MLFSQFICNIWQIKKNKHLLSFTQILSFFPQNNTKLVSFPFYRPENRETQGNPEDGRPAFWFLSTFASAQSLLGHYSLRPHFSSSIKWEGYHLSHLSCRILVRSTRQRMGKNFLNHTVLSPFGGPLWLCYSHLRKAAEEGKLQVHPQPHVTWQEPQRCPTESSSWAWQKGERALRIIETERKET